jgi:anti-sigma B factor antagonist
MPVESRQLDARTVVVTLSGRLVMGKEIERFETTVNDLVAGGKAQVFVLDVTGLDYADSSGIGTIVSCLTAIKKSGAEMRMAGANARIQRLFQITGVDHLLTMFPTVAAATAG